MMFVHKDSAFERHYVTFLPPLINERLIMVWLSEDLTDVLIGQLKF